MKIFNYLLLIYFINLCSSFFINKNFPNLILLQSNLKLNMGCDYYIDKDLYIYDYKNQLISYINLEHIGQYYTYYDLDDDDDDYEEYTKKLLKPFMKPIIIFTNNTFNKSSFEKKYRKLIDNELNINNKTWLDVNKIIKKEERYER